jgi:hypothetical protein
MRQQPFGLFFADFAKFIAFCDLHNQSALPANAAMTAHFIRHISTSGRSSASIRRAVVAISAIHLFNGFTDPTKGPDVRIAMKCMHRTLGRSAIKPMVFGRRCSMYS